MEMCCLPRGVGLLCLSGCCSVDTGARADGTNVTYKIQAVCRFLRVLKPRWHGNPNGTLDLGWYFSYVGPAVEFLHGVFHEKFNALIL